MGEAAGHRAAQTRIAVAGGVRGPEQHVLDTPYSHSLSSPSRAREQTEVCVLASADVGKNSINSSLMHEQL